MDQFGSLQPIDRLGQGVVVAVATAAHRGRDPGLGQAFGVENRNVLGPPVGMENQGIRAFGLPVKLVFPQFTRHFSQRSLTLPLELMGAELIEVLMASNTIVETLDVIEDF